MKAEINFSFDLHSYRLITTVLVSLILIGTTFDNCTNFDVKVDLLKIKQQNKFK